MSPEYSEIETDSFSDEYGTTEVARDQPAPKCCKGYRTILCCIAFIILIIWLLRYDYQYFLDDGSSYSEKSEEIVYLSSPVSSQSHVVSNQSHKEKTEALDESPADDYVIAKSEPRDYQDPYPGQPADQFVAFMGMMLFVYLFIRCTCGKR
jgi:hypothetical protein